MRINGHLRLWVDLVIFDIEDINLPLDITEGYSETVKVKLTIQSHSLAAWV
jgi:hypothetical protein